MSWGNEKCAKHGAGRMGRSCMSGSSEDMTDRCDFDRFCRVVIPGLKRVRVSEFGFFGKRG